MTEVTITDDHQYLVDGIERPGVTTIIKDAGLMGYLPEDQYYRDRGSFVHEAIKLYFRGTLDRESLSEGIKGYVDSAIEWITAHRFSPAYVEHPLYHPLLQYCGTLDTVPLIDWKTSVPQPWHKVQLASYMDLIKHNGLTVRYSCMSVNLRANGKLPKATNVLAAELAGEMKTFTSALYLYNWKKNNIRRG